MRKTMLIGAALALVAGGALAQTPPAKDGPQNSAINTDNSTNRMVNAPVKGSNSFTESEAKSRIEKQGFTNVSGLTKDEDGVWRGRAMKNGRQTQVSLDYQGNVIEGGAGSSAPATAPRSGAGR